ncbi:MAG: hypothetical protein HLX51_11755 [Micrococcaceae bacterium]|nr:hypothetical protein [Micrococcaceae bacterium]
MSEKAKAACEVTGGVLAVAGVALVYIPAALILAGLALIVVGNLPKGS